MAEGKKRCLLCLEKARIRNKAWRSNKVANGLCGACGGELDHYRTLCDVCCIKARKRNRKSTGYEPRKIGGVGRPCVVPD